MEIILIVLTIILVGVWVILFIDKNFDFISVLVILAVIASVIWFTYKFYKPAFTDVLFSDDGIVSKTHFEQEKLSMNDIKGIWYYKNTQGGENKVKLYSGKDTYKGCVIVIGDISRFKDVEYIGLNGITLLRDSFNKGYTTLYYRKKLDEVLEYYNRKIQNKPETEVDNLS